MTGPSKLAIQIFRQVKPTGTESVAKVRLLSHCSLYTMYDFCDALKLNF